MSRLQPAKGLGSSLVHSTLETLAWRTRLSFPFQLHSLRLSSSQVKCATYLYEIHGALRSGYATMRNAQCNNSEDNLF